jgi:hypothetical protein
MGGPQVHAKLTTWPAARFWACHEQFGDKRQLWIGTEKWPCVSPRIVGNPGIGQKGASGKLGRVMAYGEEEKSGLRS